MILTNEELSLDTAEGLPSEVLGALLQTGIENLSIPVITRKKDGKTYLEFSAEHIQAVKEEIEKLEKVQKFCGAIIQEQKIATSCP